MTGPGASTVDLEEVRAEIARLATLDRVAYDRCRKEEAKRLGLSLKTLDAEVERHRPKPQNQAADAARVEALDPWPDPVDGLARDWVR